MARHISPTNVWNGALCSRPVPLANLIHSTTAAPISRSLASLAGSRSSRAVANPRRDAPSTVASTFSQPGLSTAASVSTACPFTSTAMMLPSATCGSLRRLSASLWTCLIVICVLQCAPLGSTQSAHVSYLSASPLHSSPSPICQRRLLGIANNQRILGQRFTAAAAARDRGLWSTVVQLEGVGLRSQGSDDRIGTGKLEAPPGFEPGMEVCRFREVVDLVDWPCPLVADDGRISVVFGRYPSRIRLEFE